MFKTSLTTPSVGNVTQADYINIINHALTAQFNEEHDRLDFRDRRPTEYVILGRRKIRPKRSSSISQFQNGLTNHAIVPADHTFPAPGDNTSMLPHAGSTTTGAMSVLAAPVVDVGRRLPRRGASAVPPFTRLRSA